MPSLIESSSGTKAIGARCTISVTGERTGNPGESVHYLMVPHHDSKMDKFCAFFWKLVVRGIYVGRIAVVIPWAGKLWGSES